MSQNWLPWQSTSAPLDFHLTWFLGPSEPTTQTASRLVQASLQRWPQSVPILYNGTPLPPSKLPIPMGRCGPLSNTWFLWLTPVLNPNGILIGWAVFAGLTTLTDRQTDRPRYSVGNNMPHLCNSTVIRPNNISAPVITTQSRRPQQIFEIFTHSLPSHFQHTEFWNKH